MTKRRLSTVIGCVLGGVTFTGPLAGAVLSDWQCRRGLCGHGWHLPKDGGYPDEVLVEVER